MKRLAIAIDPSCVSKAGKKTAHIGRFWSGCASAVKHGLEIRGIALVDVGPTAPIVFTLPQIWNCPAWMSSTSTAPVFRSSSASAMWSPVHRVVDCQARGEQSLDFAYNASLAAVNITKLWRKENDSRLSIGQIKLLMVNLHFAKRFICVSGIDPNLTFNAKLVKELVGYMADASYNQ